MGVQSASNVVTLLPRISSNIISVLELIFLSGVDFFSLPTKAGIFDIVYASVFPSFMQNI